ncbi:MAG: saccharopine dehydrogenase NADP-binding domain-containing protein [Alphaproteobacteria bacterium]|nr:saccharopine dehydrogenase NADP-binding domain-containing protein [Alphaproteobacteria bacterium]
MENVVILGAGDVAKAGAVKLSKVNPNLNIYLVSRSADKLKNIKKEILVKAACDVDYETIDVYHNIDEFIKFLKTYQIDTVVNLASPYVNLKVMDACLAVKANYLDTACYEAKDTKGFSYKEQLEYQEQFKQAGIVAILGAGGTPGVSNHLAALAGLELASDVKEIRILDGNAGSQSAYRFATNFSAEDNIKELDNPCKHYEDGQWLETTPFSCKTNLDDGLNYYRIYHEEQETLLRRFPNIHKIENFMSFGDIYLNYFNVLKDVGMFNHRNIDVDGISIAPIKVLASVLPAPSEVASITKGKAFITVIVKDKEDIAVTYKWLMDHQTCYADVGAGAVAWSTGVPAVMFAGLMSNKEPGVYTVEELDPKSVKSQYSKFDIHVERT